MGNELTKADFLSFMKKNLKAISIIASLVAILCFGVFLYNNYFNENGDSADTNESTSDSNASIESLLEKNEEELTMEESYRLDGYLNQGVYQFSMFIENEDSKAFNRSNLLKEFLIEEDVVNDIEATLGYSLEPSPNQIIEINYNSSNVLMTVYFKTGNLETSEEIANAYYTYIENDNLDLFRRRTVHFLDTPEPVAQEDSEVVEEPTEVNTSDANTNNFVSIILTIIFAAFVSVLFGIVFGLIGAIVISYFSKKVSSLYNYELSNQDIAINLIDKREDKEKSIVHSVLYPPVKQKLVLIEDENDVKRFSEQLEKMNYDEGNKQNMEISSSVTKVNPRLYFEEVVVLTKVGKTTKKWYREQSNQLKMYHVPKKIVKI